MNNGKLDTETEYLIQINTRRGEEYADIGILFNSFIKVSGIEGRIEDLQGNLIRELKKKDISEISAISNSSLYEDSYYKTFSLHHNSYPYRIRYRYSMQEEQYLALTEWIPVLGRKVPTHSARLELRIPRNTPVQFLQCHVPEANLDSAGDFVRYVWEIKDFIPPKAELYSPNIVDYYPRLVAIPGQFFYGTKGSFSSWKDFGNWQWELIKDTDELPAHEKLLVQELTRECSGEEEKAKVLYHYLQDNTRYINVSVEIGGLKPYPAAFVSRNKYGDCKALSNYLKALLKEAGIQAYYTKVYAGEVPRTFYKDFPSQQSNHVILTVPLKNDTVWLDCTSKLLPFGRLGSFTSNRPGLLIAPDNSRIIELERMNPEDVADNYTVYADLSAEDAEVALGACFRSDKFEYLKSLDSQLNQHFQNHYIGNVISQENTEIRSWELHQSHRDSACIHLQAKLFCPSLKKEYGRMLVIDPWKLPIPSFEKPADRTLPVSLFFPITETDSLYFDLPERIRLESFPTDTVLLSPYGEYHRKCKTEGHRLQLTKSILLYEGSIPVEEYPAFYAFIRDVQNEENKKISCKKI